MDILAEINQSGTTILLVTHDAKVAAKTERVLFMSDGVITGEKRLGKYMKDRTDVKERENELSSWLVQIAMRVFGLTLLMCKFYSKFYFIRKIP